jgi:peptidoglycan hydrolase CwlO-like protein
MFGSMERWSSTPEIVDEMLFEEHNLEVLRQQVFDLTDEIAQREEKYEARMRLKEEQGDDTGSSIVHGTETTPELIAALKRKLHNMKEVEEVLAKAHKNEQVGALKNFARKTAVAAAVAIGGAFAKETIVQPPTSTKSTTETTIARTRSPESLV